MNSFISDEETKIATQFCEIGYIKQEVEDQESLKKIRSLVYNLACDATGLSSEKLASDFLNGFHNEISLNDLNDHRVQIIEQLNKQPWLRKAYYNLAKDCLSKIIGNELAMQLRLNLSIQMPNDESSLLPIHSDTWSGDSPFEAVLWIPLVDCFRTKSMFILPPEATATLHEGMGERNDLQNVDLYDLAKDDLEWIDIKFGEYLLFNQNLPHGNISNGENETRWTMNCRFKGLFTPYSDKKMGEFFGPITARPMSMIGMDYKLPLID